MHYSYLTKPPSPLCRLNYEKIAGPPPRYPPQFINQSPACQVSEGRERIEKKCSVKELTATTVWRKNISELKYMY
jgi:hypothetical protein